MRYSMAASLQLCWVAESVAGVRVARQRATPGYWDELPMVYGAAPPAPYPPTPPHYALAWEAQHGADTVHLLLTLYCLLYSYPFPPSPGHVPATSLPHNTHHQGHSRNGSSGNIQGTSDMHVSFSANNGRDAPLLAGEDLKLMESLDDEYVGM